MREVITSLLPFPHGYPPLQDAHPGWRLDVPAVCRRCTTRSCLEHPSPDPELRSHICSDGLDFFTTRIGGTAVSLIGLVLAEERPGPGSASVTTKHRVKREDVERVMARVASATETIQTRIDAEVKNSVASLHDVTTAVNLIQRCAETMMANYEGESDAEEMAQADPQLKSLLEAVILLNDRMMSASIAVNPEAAGFGRRRSMPIYKILDRLKNLFDKEAGQKNVIIRILGKSYNRLATYDSMKVIPLVLLDNAVKYAEHSTDVDIHISDCADGSVSIAIVSCGVLVPDEEAGRIFDKGYRCSVATRIALQGSGLGLYIADTIAKAHGFKIAYEAVPAGGGKGQNRFALTIPDCPDV